MDSFVPQLIHNRFYQNDGSPSHSDSTPIGNEDIVNINVDVDGGDQPRHLRVSIEEQGAGSAGGMSTDDIQLQFDINDDAVWNNVTASSSRIQSDTDSALTDGGATDNRTSDPISDGIGTFEAGVQEDGNGEITNFELTADNYTEHVWAFNVIAADNSNGDELRFRILYAGVAIGRNFVPRIDIVKSAAERRVMSIS